mmetsp:Transcript_13678/g.24521  ORF Transcript_13678/g.24521 Transcript_13678/m.24521 type:complete len:417 (-) Transcript_13678:410-1660(-)
MSLYPVPQEYEGQPVVLNPVNFQGSNSQLYPNAEAHVSQDGAETSVRAQDGGYYPGCSAPPPLLSTSEAAIGQLHPAYGPPSLIAKGSFSVFSPSPGAAPSTDASLNSCTLILQVDSLRIFLTKEDRTVRISPREFMLLLPSDALGLWLPVENPALSQIFQDRCTFSVEDGSASALLKETAAAMPPEEPGKDALQYASELDAAELERNDTSLKGTADERTASKLLKMSAWLSAKIVDASDVAAGKVADYGERKVGEVEPKEKDVSPSVVKASSVARKGAGKAHSLISKINDKLGEMAGNKLERHLQEDESDSEGKKRRQRMFVKSLQAYAEISDAMGEGYANILEASREPGTAYAEKKYGPNAAQSAENSIAAAYHAGSAAYNAKRVVNMKKVVKYVSLILSAVFNSTVSPHSLTT